MKKLTKTFLSVAAVSALTAAMAASASASAMTAEYVPGVDGAVNTVKLEGVAATGTSQTMIILNSNDAIVTEKMVEAIDQKDKQETDESNPVFTSVPVNALDNGTYYVRIGGTDGNIQRATFTVGQAVETEIITIGDANLDGVVGMDDATSIATKSVGLSSEDNTNVGTEKTVVSGIDKEKITIGDANVDGVVGMDDATSVATKSVGLSSEDNTNVGTAVTVVK